MNADKEAEIAKLRRWQVFWWANLPLYLLCAADALANYAWDRGYWWTIERLTILSLVYIAGLSIITYADGFAARIAGLRDD